MKRSSKHTVKLQVERPEGVYISTVGMNREIGIWATSDISMGEAERKLGKFIAGLQDEYLANVENHA